MRKLYLSILISLVAFLGSSDVWAGLCGATNIDGSDSYDKIVIQPGSTTISGYDCHENNWNDFWDNLTTLSGDVDVYVFVDTYSEDTYPATVTEDLNGYQIHVQPIAAGATPYTSDATTGPIFQTAYSTADEMVNLQATDPGGEGGQIIIEGLVFKYGSGTSPSEFIEIDGAGTSSVVIRNCVFKGNDSDTAIYYASTNAHPIEIYNNYIYDFEYGIELWATDVMPSLITGNTIHNCTEGIDANNLSGWIINNNLFQSCGTASCSAVSNSFGHGNLSDDASCEDADFSSGSDNVASTRVNFTDVAADDFTFGPGETEVIDSGVGDVTSYDSYLVAHYEFEPGALTTDSTGNYTLNDSGTPETAYPGMLGDGSVAFDSGEHYVTVPSSGTFPGYNNDNDFTVCAWVNPSHAGGGSDWCTVASVWGTVDQAWTLIKTGNDYMSFYIQRSDDSGAMGDISSLQMTCNGEHWYHVCAAWDNTAQVTRIRVYNSTNDTTTTDVSSSLGYGMYATATENFEVNSSSSGANDCAGKIDDLRIYNGIAMDNNQMDDIRNLRLNRDGFDVVRQGNVDIGAYEYRDPNRYVSVDNGSDSNDGTSGSPWATIDKVESDSMANDTIYFAQGDTWTGEELFIPYSGQTYSSYNDGGSTAKPIIDGNNLQAHGFYGSSVSGITIEGFEVKGWHDRGIINGYGNNWTIRNNYIHSDNITNNDWGVGISHWGTVAYPVDTIVIQDNTIGSMLTTSYGMGNWGYFGIAVRGGTNVTITGNSLDLGGYTAGINVALGDGVPLTSNINITNNEVQDFGGFFGIGLYSTDNSIADNVISYNKVHDGSGAGILLKYADNVNVHHNTVYDLTSYAGSMFNGIDVNQDSDDGIMAFNTIYKVSNSCATIEDNDGTAPSDNWKVYNNIFDASANTSNGTVRAAFGYISDDDMNLESDNNIFYPPTAGDCSGDGDPFYVGATSTPPACKSMAEWQTLQGTTYGQTDYDTNSSTSDPVFTSVVDGSENFGINSTSSPAVDGGDDTIVTTLGYSLNDDLFDSSGRQIPEDGDNDGTETVDIGAYEYRYPALNGPYGLTITGGAIQGGAQ